VNKADLDGKTAIFYSLDSPSDDADVLEHLVNNGASINHCLKSKETILKYLFT